LNLESIPRIFYRFKLESKDEKIIASCCLRSKLYSILYENQIPLIKMKGQPGSSIKANNISFKSFTRLLKGKTNPPSKYYRIGSKNHKVSKFLQKKATLVSAFDDKRWMFDCMIHSLPYGSFYARKKNSKLCPFCKKIKKKSVWGFHEFFFENKCTYLKIYSKSLISTKIKYTWNNAGENKVQEKFWCWIIDGAVKEVFFSKEKNWCVI
jgi:hypothetical protein